jgi:hypothetical protein
MGDDHSDLETLQLGCKHRVTILFSLRKAMLDNDVLSFYVTQLTQPLHEGFDTVRGIGREAGT